MVHDYSLGSGFRSLEENVINSVPSSRVEFLQCNVPPFSRGMIKKSKIDSNRFLDGLAFYDIYYYDILLILLIYFI